MKTKALTPEEQIELLIKIKNKIKRRFVPAKFICCIYNEVRFELGTFGRTINLHDLVPLFTLENAKQFGAKCNHSRQGGWWRFNEEKLRIDFLNWIIEENRKLINK